MVLFVFVIMLLNLPVDEDGADRLRLAEVSSEFHWVSSCYLMVGSTV